MGLPLNIASIEKKLLSDLRITREEATWLYFNAESDQLKRLASIVKSRFHDARDATWTMMCIINFTNICVAKCDFCAFYRLPHQEGTYTLSPEQLLAKVAAFRELGNGYVGFNGGFNPGLSLSVYREVFGQVRHHYPDMTLYEMTIPEFMFYCKLSKVPYEEGAAFLKESGTSWIPGGGAEVLSQSFRSRHSPGKYTVGDFYKAQSAVISQGIGTTATMVIGMDETIDERMDHLEGLRSFQDLNKAIPSFLCWTYKPYHTEFGGSEIDDRDYFRWLAVSRIYLDNIRHIRTSVLTKNENALTGLDYGADDFDLPTSDEVIEKAGGNISSDFESVLNSAKNLGYSLKERGSFVVRQ